MNRLRRRPMAALLGFPPSRWSLPPQGASRRCAVALFAFTAALCFAPAAAQAAAPQLGAAWVTDVTAASATLHAEVNPEGLSTTYRFEYITEAAYQENLKASRESFSGAARVPAGTEASLGSASSPQSALQHVSALRPATTYRYRIAATSSGVGGGASVGSPHTFATQELSGAFVLPDERGWELV
ncbi:MAG: hypothetical protein WB507_04825, partial [Solirubrobacterales bacterium]